MKNHIAANKHFRPGYTLLSFTIAAALSTGIIAVALKYYMAIKTIFWQQQAIILRLQQKEIVYSFLQRDLSSCKVPVEVYNQAIGKLAAKITRQIKHGSTILLVQDVAYYLGVNSKGYTLFRDDFVHAAVGVADGIADFTVQITEHTDQADKKIVVLLFRVEYVRHGEKDINTKQQFKLVAASA